MSVIRQRIKKIVVICGKTIFFLLYIIVIISGLAICAGGAYLYYSVNKGNPDIGIAGQALCSLVEFGLGVVSRIADCFNI